MRTAVLSSSTVHGADSTPIVARISSVTTDCPSATAPPPAPFWLAAYGAAPRLARGWDLTPRSARPSPWRWRGAFQITRHGLAKRAPAPQPSFAPLSSPAGEGSAVGRG